MFPLHVYWLLLHLKLISLALKILYLKQICESVFQNVFMSIEALTLILATAKINNDSRELKVHDIGKREDIVILFV